MVEIDAIIVTHNERGKIHRLPDIIRFAGQFGVALCSEIACHDAQRLVENSIVDGGDPGVVWITNGERPFRACFIEQDLLFVFMPAV